MLVFVDESGDAGKKIDRGSSPYFFLATLVFPDRNVAQTCDDCIGKLRSTLRLRSWKEFHFNKDDVRIRDAFLQCVAAFDFWYSVFALDKSRLTGPDFQNKTSIYKWTVKLAFESIFDHLQEATVVFDRCGGREFTRQLKTYLRQAMNEKAGNPDHGRIKRVRDDRSASNNLLQMADMVCGAVARSFSAIKTDHDRYRDIIREREREVKVWTGA